MSLRAKHHCQKVPGNCNRMGCGLGLGHACLNVWFQRQENLMENQVITRKTRGISNA